jgi:hypothetical protein
LPVSARDARFTQTAARIVVVAGLLLVTGCASVSKGFNATVETVDSALMKEVGIEQCGMTQDDAFNAIDSRKLTAEIARELCLAPGQELASANSPALVIPDLVNLQTFRPEALGIGLGEVLRANIFNICKVPVRQVELARSFKLDPDGLVALSRDLNQVKDKTIPAQSAIIGTYNLQRNKMTVVVRKLSLESSLVESIVTKEVRWRCASPGFGRPSFSYTIK